MTRKALGRGLSALLPSETETLAEQAALGIDITLIDPNPAQPRSHFDEQSLEDLAKSIRENGIVQPLLLRRNGKRFELVTGERRWRAAQRAGLETVPAVVRDIPDEKLLELALIENIQREDLNAIEEAQAYKKLIDTIGLTQEALATRVGRDRSYITNYLRLLRLPEDLQRFVQEGKLSTGHARTLLGVDDVELQRRLARKIIGTGLSVRQTERAIRQIVGTASSASKKASLLVISDPNVRAAETHLRRQLGTQVRIVENRESPGAGRVEIDYYNKDDLDRIYSLLTAYKTGRN
jgi:ParB family chromosome partitioning protein